MAGIRKLIKLTKLHIQMENEILSQEADYGMLDIEIRFSIRIISGPFLMHG